MFITACKHIQHLKPLHTVWSCNYTDFSEMAWNFNAQFLHIHSTFLYSIYFYVPNKIWLTLTMAGAWNTMWYKYTGKAKDKGHVHFFSL